MTTTWPSTTDYEQAVRNLGKYLFAPQFKGGSPILSNGPLRMLDAYPGGNCVVYPIQVESKKIALRCWIKDPGNVKERFEIARQYLKSNPCPYLVDFGYVDNEMGIEIKGNHFPISFMEWIEGVTLSKFLDENVHNSPLIRDLAEKFKLMVADLHRRGISHGDLQDENIMIYREGNSFEIKLVDYDSLFVPTIKGTSISLDKLPGVPGFQHPKRSNLYDGKMDYFSELVIYLSLCAYSELPSFWKHGHQENKLLFEAEDFNLFKNDPSRSEIYRELKNLSPFVQYLTENLIIFCREKNTVRIPPLERRTPFPASSEGVRVKSSRYNSYSSGTDITQVPQVPVPVDYTWDPLNAFSNPKVFLNIPQGKKRTTKLKIKPISENLRLHLRIKELPEWLKVSPTTFVPPVDLNVTIDAKNQKKGTSLDFKLKLYLDE